jgi:SAM-dependent methyltransferase
MSRQPWYREWFGEEYLRLYPHRDAEEARRAVRLVLSAAPHTAGERTLDLGCGSGRHLHELAAAGLRPAGLDLSWTLLEVARGTGVPLVRGDMRRLPFADRSFALVSSFFTSFGYFLQEEEDLDVLREVWRVLRPGGTLALDFLNAGMVRRDLRPRDEQTVEGRRVVQTRSLVNQGSVVEKRIEIEEPGGQIRVFHERVRLYDPHEIERMLRETGFDVRARFGDYGGGAVGETSPRAIFVAERP